LIGHAVLSEEQIAFPANRVRLLTRERIAVDAFQAAADEELRNSISIALIWTLAMRQSPVSFSDEQTMNDENWSIHAARSSAAVHRR
jgi:hypothetical protein